MPNALNRNLQYDAPIKVADDVYWVGFADPTRGLYCNPYLIIDGNEGVLIDGGSRPEFSMVMMKIMRTGLAPSSISTLIYQHYDPDLCGSVANLEEIINRSDLRIISKHENNVFIRYYGVSSRLMCIDELGHQLVLRSGRRLKFITTPYAHTAGSFMTFDEKTKVLFSSDLLGSFDVQQDRPLFRELPAACLQCERNEMPTGAKTCDATGNKCPVGDILAFHREEMPTGKALRLACSRITAAGATIVAPQHGSVWHRRVDVEYLARRLSALQDVGIDRITEVAA